MKKNLNIAYLNGAEGIIRRGANEGSEESGGSGSGSSAPQYYKFDKDAAMASNLDLFKLCHYIVGACAFIRNEWYDTIEIQTSGKWIYGLWDSGGNFGKGDVLNYLVGLCFIPCKMTSESDELKQYNTLEEFSADRGVENTSFLVPISEEEFYSSEFFYPQS